MFSIPQAEFYPLEHARLALISANDLKLQILSLFIDGYHKFWGVGSAPVYTVYQMQQKIDAMGKTSSENIPDPVKQLLGITETVEISTGLYVMVLASCLVNFISTYYNQSIDAKYFEAAFNYTINQDYTITIGELKEVWRI